MNASVCDNGTFGTECTRDAWHSYSRNSELVSLFVHGVSLPEAGMSLP